MTFYYCSYCYCCCYHRYLGRSFAAAAAAVVVVVVVGTMPVVVMVVVVVVVVAVGSWASRQMKVETMHLAVVAGVGSVLVAGIVGMAWALGGLRGLMKMVIVVLGCTFEAEDVGVA